MRASRLQLPSDQLIQDLAECEAMVESPRCEPDPDYLHTPDDRSVVWNRPGVRGVE